MSVVKSGEQFRAELLAAGLLRDTGVAGVYHRSGTFERIIRGIEALVSAAAGGQGGEQYFFPPMMAADAFVHTGYLKSFPNLIGSVNVFTGTDRDHAELLRRLAAGEDWAAMLTPSELMQCSAACHQVYPYLDKQLPATGTRVECQSYIFRHEPSPDPARMQLFRMHEFVFIGAPADTLAHRDSWLARGLKLYSDQLGLDVVSAPANDPFFGRAGRMLAASQRESELKFEVLTDICGDKPTAIASANYHQDHFTSEFSIRLPNGELAHTACFGFGLERTALALLSQHGLDPGDWPDSVRQALWT